MKDATIAFAGMLQASELVRQIATSGHCSGQATQASIASVFSRSPDSTEAVYGGIGGVRLGLRVLTELCSRSTTRWDWPSWVSTSSATGGVNRRLERNST